MQPLARLLLGLSAFLSLPAHGQDNAGLSSSLEHRFAAVAGKAKRPPIACPALQIDEPQTLVIVAADTVIPEVDVLMRYLNGMPGEFHWYRVGSNRPLPVLTGVHVIVYWDLLTETVSRKADSATRVSKGECGDAVDALRQWWQLKPGRSAVLDGRAMSMFARGTLTMGGTRELKNMWQYVASNAAGGLLVLGGDGSQQACLGRVLGGLGFGSVRGSEPNSTFGMPGDSRSPLWMCPQPALHRSQRYWSTFGFPARYAVSASSGGGVVPYGVQPNKVYLRGVAYYGGDITKPAISVTVADPEEAIPKLLLQAKMTSPVDGAWELASCAGVSLEGLITQASGKPPYTFTWTDVSSPAYPILLGQAVISAEAAAAPGVQLRAGATVKLANGTHIIRLAVTDAEESLAAASATVSVSDTAEPLRVRVASARLSVQRSQEALGNVTASTRETVQALADTRGRIAALQKTEIEEGRAAAAHEAKTEALAAEVGELAGRLRAHVAIIAARRSDAAELKAQVLPLVRETGELEAQRKALAERVQASAADTAAVEKLQSTVQLLQGKEASLNGQLSSLAAQTAKAAASIKAMTEEAATTARNSTATLAAFRLQTAEAVQRAKVEVAVGEKLQATVEANGKQLQSLRDRTEATKGQVQILSAQLRAVQQTAGQLAEQAAHTASDLQAAASQSSLAHGELESIGASLGYSSLPPGIFQPPAAPSAAAGDSSAAGVALAAAVSAAAQQGVDRSPLAANTAVLQAAVTAMTSEAEQLRQRVYAGQLEEQQLAQSVQGLEDSVSALRFAVTGSTNALAGERRRIAALTRQIAADKASLKKVAASNAAAQAALAKAEAALAALNARVDKLQRRKGGLERDVVKWSGMADDMDAVEEAKAQQAKDSAAAKNL